jgi:hypothetical protein
MASQIVKIGCTFLCVACVVWLASSFGCQRGPDRVHPVKPSSSAAEDAIAMFDTNKDGMISGAELDKCPGLKFGLARLDPSRKGVTAEMIAKRIAAWKDSKLGKMSLCLQFSHNGKPLVDADVRLVPEKFLGPDMLQNAVATGKTEAGGSVMLTIPLKNPTDPAGVCPGYYRVEVTKKGLNIPAKYNTDTIFGMEVAIDVEELQQGSVQFKLEF